MPLLINSFIVIKAEGSNRKIDLYELDDLISQLPETGNELVGINLLVRGPRGKELWLSTEEENSKILKLKSTEKPEFAKNIYDSLLTKPQLFSPYIETQKSHKVKDKNEGLIRQAWSALSKGIVGFIGIVIGSIGTFTGTKIIGIIQPDTLVLTNPKLVGDDNSMHERQAGCVKIEFERNRVTWNDDNSIVRDNDYEVLLSVLNVDGNESNSESIKSGKKYTS